MVPDATKHPKHKAEPLEPDSSLKKNAKAPIVSASLSVEDRIRDCILADDIEGALKLMNGIIAETTGYHCRRLGIADMHEDCINDTIIRIMTRLDLIIQSDKLIGYIRKIAFRTVINEFRKHRRIPEDPFPLIDPECDDSATLEFQQDMMPQPDQVVLIAESAGLFKQALNDVYRLNPGCRESLKLYQDAQNDDTAFDTFCKMLEIEYQAMYARFRRCIEKIIEHHLFHKFSDIVARLYPNILRNKQRKRAGEGKSS
jgi:RNA polymerase sigma factor (sigma-70 family)